MLFIKNRLNVKYYKIRQREGRQAALESADPADSSADSSADSRNDQRNVSIFNLRVRGLEGPGSSALRDRRGVT